MKTIILCLALIFCVSCTKSSGDTQKPLIVLNTPAGNQEFSASSTVVISGTVSDNDELHEVHVFVTDITHSAEVVHFHEHVDASTYTINQSFTVQASTTYRIQVEADDLVGNTTEVDIQVKGI